MEVGALVAGFSPLKCVIGGFLLGHIFIQHDSAEVVTRKQFFVFINFLFLTYICL